MAQPDEDARPEVSWDYQTGIGLCGRIEYHKFLKVLFPAICFDGKFKEVMGERERERDFWSETSVCVLPPWNSHLCDGF